MAATPSPNFTDQQQLAQDPGFQARVIQSVIQTCFNIGSEAITATMPLSLHLKRASFAVQTLMNILSNPTTYATFFAKSVVTDATVMGAATVGGTVPITSLPIAAAQAPLVTDLQISNAISGQWNSFFNP